MPVMSVAAARQQLLHRDRKAAAVEVVDALPVGEYRIGGRRFRQPVEVGHEMRHLLARLPQVLIEGIEEVAILKFGRMFEQLADAIAQALDGCMALAPGWGRYVRPLLRQQLPCRREQRLDLGPAAEGLMMQLG